ncbi:MAG: endonuclease/exonuclease/phosphatase family protein [Candidatus Paceibacterota bacterium]
MKLITLNVWGGLKERELAKFFQKKKGEVDIFCLQEVNHDSANKNINYPDDNFNFFSEISDILSEFSGYFRPSIEDHYGLATFVHEDISVLSEDDIFVRGDHGDIYDFEKGKDHARNIQHLQIKKDGNGLVVHNFHGMWAPKGKIDTPERLRQAQNVKEHLSSINAPQIIAGDFNSRPDTESMKIIEDDGLRNLVKEYGVTDTRTKFYEKEERFADYILVSDGIQVNDFKVLPDEVSDHAPLYLDFAIM